MPFLALTDPTMLWIIGLLGLLHAAVLACVLGVLWYILRRLGDLENKFAEDIKVLFHSLGRLQGRDDAED